MNIGRGGTRCAWRATSSPETPQKLRLICRLLWALPRERNRVDTSDNLQEMSYLCMNEGVRGYSHDTEMTFILERVHSICIYFSIIVIPKRHLFPYKSFQNAFIPVFIPNKIFVWNFILVSCKLKPNFVSDWTSISFPEAAILLYGDGDPHPLDKSNGGSGNEIDWTLEIK